MDDDRGLAAIMTATCPSADATTSGSFSTVMYFVNKGNESYGGDGIGQGDMTSSTYY